MKFRYLIFCLFFLIFLSLYGFCVMHVANGGKRLGILTEPLKKFALLPKTLTGDSADPLKAKWHSNYLEGPAIDQIDSTQEWQAHALSSSFDINENKWNIDQLDLRTNNILWSWSLENINLEIEEENLAFINLPVLLPEKKLLFFIHNSNNLILLDSLSQIVWHNKDYKFHHCGNLDNQGHFWSTAYGKRNIFMPSSNTWLTYLDDLLLQIDVSTGKVLFEKSLTDILEANELKELIFRSCNNYKSGNDPLHTNDIQPALSDSKYWLKNDLFLSVRNRSMIVQYRPANDSIIRIIEGPFYNQHDIDIISDKEIALFNNNVFMLGYDSKSINKDLPTDTIGLSNIIRYNFETSQFDTLIYEHFENENIFSASQSCFEILDDDIYYVENQNKGIIYLFKEDKVLLKKTLSGDKDNTIAKPHWLRVWSPN